MDDFSGRGDWEQDTAGGGGGAEPTSPHGRGWREPPEFGVGNAIGMGWGVFTSRYGLLLGASCLYLLITIAASAVAFVTSLFTLLPLVDWAAQFLFYPLMWIGLMWLAVRITRGENGEIADLFAGFKRYWPVVGANALMLLVLYAIFMMGAVILGVSVAAIGFSGGLGGSSGGAAVVIGFVLISVLVMFVPILIVVPRLVFAPMICLDTSQRVLGPFQSFKTSWRMTGRPGVWSGLILLWLIFMVLSVVCTILLLLPLLFVAMPLGVAVTAASYWQISRQYWRGLEHECNVCAYDLRGTRAETCPECGEPIPPEKLGLI